MIIDNTDAHTVLQYKLSLERKRGYFGPCFICIKKLRDLHMYVAQLQTTLILLKLKQGEFNPEDKS